MTIEEKIKERRHCLTEELLKLKSEGFHVFINKENPKLHNDYVYGLITDGTNMIYVEVNKYGSTLFTTAFEYVPDKKTGSCCPAIEEGYGYKHLTKEAFEESVEEGRRTAYRYKATLYKNFDHYMKLKQWEQNNLYVEL